MRKEEFVRFAVASVLSAALYWHASDYLERELSNPRLLVNSGFLLAAAVYVVFLACLNLFKK